jgi:hypothetical protein
MLGLLRTDHRFDAVRGLALGVVLGAALWVVVGGIVWALLRVDWGI